MAKVNDYLRPMNVSIHPLSWVRNSAPEQARLTTHSHSVTEARNLGSRRAFRVCRVIHCPPPTELPPFLELLVNFLLAYMLLGVLSYFPLLSTLSVSGAFCSYLILGMEIRIPLPAVFAPG